MAARDKAWGAFRVDPEWTKLSTTAGYTKKDYGLDLCGYIVKDRLWFFGAYDRVDNSLDSTLPGASDTPSAGQSVTSTSKRNLAAGKLTFRLNESQSLIGTFFQDPRDDGGAIIDANHSLNGDPATYGLPLDLYARMREEDPCVKIHLDDPLLIDEVWVVSRHQDIWDIDRDPERLAAAVERGVIERVVGRLPPGLAAGLGHDRRDHIHELGDTGDLHPVGAADEGVE